MGPLTHADRPLWKAAATTQDLANLTVHWLEGGVKSQPGYWGPCDVDDAPDLREALIECNRAGFLTADSQKGFVGPGYDGSHVEQYACVTGFVPAGMLWISRWLNEMTDPPFGLILHNGGRPRGDDYSRAYAMTLADGVCHTTYGAHLSRATIRTEMYHGCSKAAIDAVCQAWQVTVYDPDPGSNDLWPALRHAAAAARLLPSR